MTEPTATEGAKPRDYFERNMWTAYFCLTFSMVTSAVNIIVGRYLRDDIVPMGFVFWRSLLALVILVPFVLPHLREQFPILLRHWKLMIALGTTSAIGGTGFVYYGLKTTTALNAGLVTATQPIMTMVLAWLVLGDYITKRQGVGVFVALMGATVIVTRGDLNVLLGLQLVIGDIWVQGGILGWALFTVLIKKYAPRELNQFVLFFGTTAGAIVVALPLYRLEIGFGGAMPADQTTILIIIYAAIGGTVISVITYTIGIVYIGPGIAGMYANLVPVFTAVLAIGVLGEVLELYHAVGIVLVFAGIYLTTVKRSRRSREAPT